MSESMMTKLLQLMAALRAPERGCPWDLEQTFESLVSYTLEEAYEVVDCIERKDYLSLRGELGDLLFQVVFYAQIAKENGLFEFDDIVQTLAEKLTLRHPHVFDAAEKLDADEQARRWEDSKAAKRRADGELSVLADLPANLPALVRAQKMQKRVARVGFDWPSTAGVREKVVEELAELEQAEQNGDITAIEEEFGDLMFSCVNWGRFLGLDTETALRKATNKFEQRFRALENDLRDTGREIENESLESLEQHWQAVKLKNL